MKRITFVFLILFILCGDFANADALQVSNMAPATVTTTQTYGNYTTGTVKLIYLPDSCYIIIGQYNNGICISAEVRKYQAEAEIFTIPDEADVVKVTVWKNFNDIKPITKAEIIDIKSVRERDKKVDEIAKKLKTTKNKNVITYKTEKNEPRAVIWTKGIDAPLLSEFEKETDITDSSYSFLYAGQDKGSGWYDVNKSLPQEDGADSNMCYAAVSANQLHWWLDQNKNNIDAFLEKQETGEMTSEKQAKLEQLKEIRNSYEGQSKSGIYNLFRRYFQSPVYAYNADLLNDFFINGYQVNTMGKVNSPDFFKWDPRGGFFYDIFNTNILTKRYSAGDYTVFKRDIIYYMKDGQSIGIIHGTPTSGVTHIITLWGVEIDHNNEITALFVTDSDDYEQPEIGMKRMLLKKNSSGYPLITTKNDGSNTGAQILEFVPLSLGEEFWSVLF